MTTPENFNQSADAQNVNHGATPSSSPSQPYGQAGNSYAPQGLPTHPRETMILVFGILGVLVLAPLGVVALVMGNNARKEIRSGMYAESTQITVGWVLGIIATILLVIGILILIFVVIIGIGANTYA